MKILALDPATKCGWATGTAAGTWDLSVKKDESSGFRLVRFKAKLREICALESINLLFYERPGGRNTNPIITQSEIIGVLKDFCIENQIEFRGVSSTEIKKFATGKGNAGKPEMIKAAQDKLGYTGSDDNTADAMWIYEFAKDSLGL